MHVSITRRMSTIGMGWLQRFRYGWTSAPYFGLFTHVHAPDPLAGTCSGHEIHCGLHQTSHSAVSHKSASSSSVHLTHSGGGLESDSCQQQQHPAITNDVQMTTAAATTGRIAPEVVWASPEKDFKETYLKALLYSCGSSRGARDWVAGWAVLTTSSSAMIVLAMQYTAIFDDFDAFVNEVDADSRISPLQRRTMFRCFLFDCVTMEARCGIVDSEESQDVIRERVQQIAKRLNVTSEDLAEMRAIVQAEEALQRDRSHLLAEDSVYQADHHDVAGGAWDETLTATGGGAPGSFDDADIAVAGSCGVTTTTSQGGESHSMKS